MLDREIGVAVVDKPAVKRLLTIAGVNATVAAGLVAAICDVRRFSSPRKLVSYFGLNPRVRQSGLGLAQHGRISKSAVPMPGRCWSRRPLRGLLAAPLRGSDPIDGQLPRRPGPCTPSSSASALGAVTKSRLWRRRGRWRCSSGTC